MNYICKLLCRKIYSYCVKYATTALNIQRDRKRLEAFEFHSSLALQAGEEWKKLVGSKRRSNKKVLGTVYEKKGPLKAIQNCRGRVFRHLIRHDC